MLKKLRLRIFMTIMGMATLVFAVAFAILNTTIWNTSFGTFATELEDAVKYGPSVSVEFNMGSWGAGPDARSNDTDDKGKRGSFTPIALITYDPDSGTIIQYNTDYESMSQSVRAEAIQRTIEKGNGTGVYPDLSLFYCINTTQDGQIIMAFADATAFLSSMQATRTGTLLAFVLTLIAVALVSGLLSHLITRPVKKAWDQQAEFIADASHELKTPLTVVLADADIITAHPEATVNDQMKWVNGISDEALHMKGLVEELLFLARSDEKGVNTSNNAEQVNFTALVEEACLAFDAVAFEAGVELEENVKENVEIKADRTQMERLVKSLLDNAVKYAGKNGRVKVTLSEKKKGHALLSVNNTGPTIPPEDLPRVFDRFWRSDSARTRGTSASYGLGLAIAKSIAEGQGASISVTSNEKDGTTFSVEF
jgi:two-component system, OmpR family, sensor histidine kinase CiaH